MILATVEYPFARHQFVFYTHASSNGSSLISLDTK